MLGTTRAAGQRRLEDENGHLRCSSCLAFKSPDDFYNNGRTATGRDSRCKTCLRKKYDASKSDPRKYFFDRVRQRAKAEGTEFTITIADVFIPTHCPILGILLTPVGEKISASTPSLDRVDSSRGYVPGNVAVISMKANRMKGDATIEELDRIAAWMRAHGAR